MLARTLFASTLRRTSCNTKPQRGVTMVLEVSSIHLFRDLLDNQGKDLTSVAADHLVLPFAPAIFHGLHYLLFCLHSLVLLMTLYLLYDKDCKISRIISIFLKSFCKKVSFRRYICVFHHFLVVNRRNVVPLSQKSDKYCKEHAKNQYYCRRSYC